MDKKSIEILKKYKNGSIVEDDDVPLIEKMASIGLMRCGFDLKQMKRTATTTDVGLGYADNRLFW